MVLHRTVPRLVLSPWREGIPILAGGVCSDFRVWHDADGRAAAYEGTQNGQHWMQFPEFASFCVPNHVDEVRAFAHPGAQPELIRELYYGTVLPVVLQTLGAEVLHASAIRVNGGVVAFCGDSGAGKSTLAYAFSRRGYSAWADDAVAFDVTSQGLRAMPLPVRLHLRPPAVSYFRPDPAESSPVTNWESNDLLDRESESLTALILLKRLPTSDSEKTVEAIRLMPTPAFAALLPHAYCFSLDDVERKRRMMRCYLEMAARVPIWKIRFPDGLENLSRILGEIERAINVPTT